MGKGNWITGAISGLVLGFISSLGGANASPILQGTSTSLTGINGIDVGGVLYNVAFQDGTCASVFGVCDTAHFSFTTQASATAASASLLSAIAGTPFDIMVGTVGCTNLGSCAMFTPFQADAFSFTAATAGNVFPSAFPGVPDLVGLSSGPISFDMTPVNAETWAVWSIAPTEVPEAATWAIMLIGLFGVAFVARKARRLSGLSAA